MRLMPPSLVALLALLAVAPPAMAEPHTVYFKLSDGNPKDDFVAGVSGAIEIKHARDAVAGSTSSAIPFGPILKASAAYNPPWHFHFDASALTFVARAPASCNLTTAAMEAKIVSGQPLPFGASWCPWGMRPVQEVLPPGPG